LHKERRHGGRRAAAAANQRRGGRHQGLGRHEGLCQWLLHQGLLLLLLPLCC
jgi:hypothetical protein